MRAEFGVTKEQAWVITAFRLGDEPPREIAGALGWRIALPSSDPSFYNPAKPFAYCPVLEEKGASTWKYTREEFLSH